MTDTRNLPGNIEALAQWVWQCVMGTTYCAHHDWAGADQTYWRERAESARRALLTEE